MSRTTPPGSQPLPRIGLPVNPADAGLVVALRAAARYWAATPAHWVLPVAAVALVNLLAELVLGGASITTAQLQSVLVTGPQGPDLDASMLPRLVAGPVAVGIVTLVSRWFLVANAVAGLRGRELAMGWITGAGVRTFTADMLVALSLVALFSLATTLGPAGLLLVPLVAPFALYLGLRLTFWTLAIFDGQPVFGGAGASWRITRRAVLRVFGWSLVIAAIGLLAGVPLLLLDLVLPSLPVVGAVAGGVVEMLLTAWTIVIMAILYESQRLRTDPAAYQASLAEWPARTPEADPEAVPGAVPGSPAAPSPAPAEPRRPYDPPPPPG